MNKVGTKDAERQRRTEWHRVVVGGPRAQRIAGPLRKGPLVYVDARLRTRTLANGETTQQMRMEIPAQRPMPRESRAQHAPVCAAAEHATGISG